MRSHKLLLMLVAMTVALPSASATGWLINVEVASVNVKFGVNVFGGSGDTLDVGLANRQCNDEDDVVDVGALNREGDNTCGSGCQAEQGSDSTGLTPLVATLLGNNPFAPGTSQCTDDGDTVDVGALNEEGTMVLSPQECDQFPTAPHCSGDEEDGVDVGVLNVEQNDDDDANDVGVVNCENDDTDDGIDVGLVNTEAFDDGSDTFDASILNTETADPVDRNGFNLLPGLLRIECPRLGVISPIDPCATIDPCRIEICTADPAICVAVPP